MCASTELILSFVFFLFHKFSNFIPPPPQAKLDHAIMESAAAKAEADSIDTLCQTLRADLDRTSAEKEQAELDANEATRWDGMGWRGHKLWWL